ncbi:helix-turn-helix domain-containing protein [Streptococcus bovimastitidis]
MNYVVIIKVLLFNFFELIRVESYRNYDVKIYKQRVGSKIKLIRKKYGYSMTEFANKIGVTKGAINNYEKGRVIPKFSVLDKIIKLSDNLNEIEIIHFNKTCYNG